jgi:transmembrane sensor
MKNYSHNNLEELLADDTFCHWLMGQATDSEMASWDNWLSENPDRLAIVNQAKMVVFALKNPESSLSQAEIDVEAAHILQTVQQPKVVRFIPNWLKMAASLAVLIVAGLWFFNKNTPKSTPSVSDANLAQIIDIQRISKDTVIHFSDGSTAQLKRGGSMQFAEKFVGKQRIVTLLSGEAFFDVTKNPEKPFIVMANDIVTKVLGTSFTVRTSNTEGGTSSVVVRTGRVAVFKKADFSKLETADKDIVFLTPNQQVNQKEGINPLIVSLVEKPILIEKPVDNPDFVFENVPISTVFNTLEKAYSVQIVADEAILKSCRMTISLGSKDALFEKLQVVCKVIGAKYDISDTRIIVSGKGC